MVKANWFTSYAKNSPDAGSLRRDVLDQGQNKLITHLVEKYPPIIATLPAAPEEAVGWVCRDFGTVHFVYVKHSFRRLGIGAALVTQVKEHTHRTRIGELFFKKQKSVFNPYALWALP